MDYLDILDEEERSYEDMVSEAEARYEEERSYEDMVSEAEARYEYEREEAQLKYLEEKENV